MRCDGNKSEIIQVLPVQGPSWRARLVVLSKLHAPHAALIALVVLASCKLITKTQIGAVAVGFTQLSKGCTQI
jgi:hypothetical protein